MCRFLLVKSSLPVHPSLFLEPFARQARQSLSFDGDWQGDGWGIKTMDMGKPCSWKTYKSLRPIWEEEKIFGTIPKSRIFLIHARSSSFGKHKDNIEFNQPYSESKFAFVFNGLLQGVRLPSNIPGSIGAQKIWHLLHTEMASKPPEEALAKVKDKLGKHSRLIQALNIGVCDGEYIYALNHFTKFPDYYTMHTLREANLSLISSLSLEGYSLKPMEKGRVVRL